MGDKKTLAKARMELEELYMGIPDESVNLTFQDLADVNLNNQNTKTKSPDQKKMNKMESFSEIVNAQKGRSSPSSSIPSPNLAKLPSLDFNKAIQATMIHNHHDHRGHGHNHDHDHPGDISDSSFTGHSHHHRVSMNDHQRHDHNYGHASVVTQLSPRSLAGDHGGHFNRVSPTGHSAGFSHGMAYDDVSGMSMTSMYQERGGRRRPGIPHSDICTICSTYIYIFKTRCLVCGRVYCRQCVEMGMGEMTEGRKCIQCLGRKFSHRYIERAGKVGCCSWRYPSMMKQAELKWAEKGPRRSGERGYGAAVGSCYPEQRVLPVLPQILQVMSLHLS
ncbi:extra-large guanine nucleotide-binding protein 3-like [Quillaja saponaria]|uniref:Extra-large guanine nucleotide-binding protein 3-like n=1 Tax=Quillaja saponaria TaxID=32244 RepID=A0AAD7LVS3_QUISA|nr:extra-large guanine nucleotide-binding protein 3-like [Quillaja saponaria]